MPGKFRKAPVRRQSRSAGSRKSIRKSKPSISKSLRRTPLPTRIPNKVSRRASNIPRAQNRIARRQAVKKKLNKTQPRPRPVVRPTNRPTKKLAKKPAPPPATLKRSFKRTAPRSSRATTARPPASMGRRTPSAAASAAVAAGTLLTINLTNVHSDIAPDATSLQATLTDLQNRADFSDIFSDLANLDTTITNVLNLLESAREKGYVFQSDMEDIAYDAMDRWQSVRGQVEKAIPEYKQQASAKLTKLNPGLRRLNASLRNPTSAGALLSTAQDQANQALWDIQQAENTLENNYEDIENDVRLLNGRLTDIHWAIDQLAESAFKLETGEDLVMAVPTRWDKEGKDDPEGVLYLTTRQLAFERKEKVATKKVLFVTTSSELVQEVLFAQPLDSITKTKAQSKGLFGHQDFLEVEFAERKLGTLSLHLNGQESEEWAVLIGRVQSGQIEEERATGSGLSFTDLTGDLTNGDLLAIQNEVNELQDEMLLKDVQDDLSELENKVSTLARDLADLRARGYAVEKSLEADIQVLTAQWDQVKDRTVKTIEHQTGVLGEQMAVIHDDLAALMARTSNLTAARPKYIQLKSSIASAEAQAEAAEDTVLDLYDEYADEVDSLAAHFDWIDWMLEALSTASFRLLATESGVAATEAIWERPGLEPENGILFLTDQRLLWEDRVETFELKIDVPLQLVVNVEKSSDDQAEFDVLEATFEGSSAPVPTAQFQLALPVADDWLQMVGRARSGDYTTDRAVEIDEAEVERVRNAPEQCPNCGAAFTTPVLRGQNEITCEFCGVSTRI